MGCSSPAIASTNIKKNKNKHFPKDVSIRYLNIQYFYNNKLYSKQKYSIYLIYTYSSNDLIFYFSSKQYLYSILSSIFYPMHNIILFRNLPSICCFHLASNVMYIAYRNRSKFFGKFVTILMFSVTWRMHIFSSFWDKQGCTFCCLGAPNQKVLVHPCLRGTGSSDLF